MIDRIFDRDPYQAEAIVHVLSCRPSPDGFLAIFDQTIFYPKGGGQPSDRGSAGGAQVLDVTEEQGEILHLLDRAIPEGETMLKLDFTRRFDHMQQHTGQHILSTVLEDLYQDDTLISRIEDNAHIELIRELSVEQLMKAQDQVNQLIRQARPVSCYYVSPEEAMKLPIRGHLTPHEQVRLVEIDGFDLNGCGGTHCSSTDQVKELVITGAEMVRGAFRVYYQCGGRAEKGKKESQSALLRMQQAWNVESAARLEEKTEACRVQMPQLDEKVKALRETLLDSETERMCLKGQALGKWLLIDAVFEDGDVRFLKGLSERLTAEENRVVLFAVSQNGQVSLIWGRSKGKAGPDLGKYLKELMSGCSGRGGGSMILAQGMMPWGEKEQLALEKARQAIREQLTAE